MIRGTTAKHTTRKYVGKCIYCSAVEDLRDEHCIPESLNGLYLLEKASCAECEKITCKFEGRFAGNTLLPVRTALNMKSKRSKSKRPKEFPMEFIKEGNSKVISVPVDDHLSIIPLLELGPTGKYPLDYHAKGIKHRDYRIIPFNIRSQEHIFYLAEKYDADELKVDFDIYIEDFLRLIAKIAYCNTVWRYGLKNIEEVYVLPAILGQSNDIWNWVGGDGLQTILEATKHMNTDHLVATRFHENREIHARIKLFKKSETPEYIVIVGRLTELAHDFYKIMGFR